MRVLRLFCYLSVQNYWVYPKPLAILFVTVARTAHHCAMVLSPVRLETRMDRGTRIAIVVSVAWVGFLWWAWQECNFCGRRAGDVFYFGALPVAIYWAYRFIRSGRPSKINQPE